MPKNVIYMKDPLLLLCSHGMMSKHDLHQGINVAVYKYAALYCECKLHHEIIIVAFMFT